MLFSLCMILLCGISVSAANPVIPKTSFPYDGTDVQSSVESIYRSDHAFFKDEADILTSASEDKLWEKVQATSDELNINIAVFIGGNYRTDDETVTFTTNSISYLFGSSSDTLFVYLDFEGYSPAYDYIRTSNNAENIFTETKRNKILNVMYKKLPKSTEPVYEEPVQQAISDGLDEIKNQGYVNSTQQTPDYRSNSPAASPRTERGRETPRTEIGSELLDFVRKIPTPIIIAVVVGIVILIIISSIVKSIKRRINSSFGNSYYNNGGYYNQGGSYHSSHNGYYGGRSRHYDSYHSRPPRHRPPRTHHEPPRSSRPPRNSAPPSGSSHSGSPHSSGSGHYR